MIYQSHLKKCLIIVPFIISLTQLASGLVFYADSQWNYHFLVIFRIIYGIFG
jgi:hypothetical protein